MAVDCSGSCTVEAPAGGVLLTTGDQELSPAPNEVVTIEGAGTLALDSGSSPSPWAQQNLDADTEADLPPPDTVDGAGVKALGAFDGSYALTLTVTGPPGGDAIPEDLEYQQGEVFNVSLTVDGAACAAPPCDAGMSANEGATGTAHVESGAVTLDFTQPIDCFDETFTTVVVAGIGVTTVHADLTVDRRPPGRRPLGGHRGRGHGHAGGHAQHAVQRRRDAGHGDLAGDVLGPDLRLTVAGANAPATGDRPKDRRVRRRRAGRRPGRRRRTGRPRRGRRRGGLSSRSRVSARRVPDMPIGWPRAMAPPLTLTTSSPMPRSAIDARPTAAKASLSSNRSTSPTDRAGLLQGGVDGPRRLGEQRRVGPGDLAVADDLAERLDAELARPRPST